MKKSVIDYIPKKHRKYILDCYKEKHCYGTLYSAVLQWEDGFQRIVNEDNLVEFKATIKELIEVDRNYYH